MTPGVNFTNTRSFCASRFTLILLAHGVERKAQKWSVYLSVHTNKDGQFFLLVKQNSAKE
jgi:hypothetical protein